jgi:hypothetical protein
MSCRLEVGGKAQAVVLALRGRRQDDELVSVSFTVTYSEFHGS